MCSKKLNPTIFPFQNCYNLRFIRLLIKNGQSLFNRLICIILPSRWQNHQKFEVTTAKEINKCKMFLHFYAFKHLIRGSQPEFLMVRSGLKKYHPGKKEYFRPISESYLTGVF